jgi:hypothetical protein
MGSVGPVMVIAEPGLKPYLQRRRWAARALAWVGVMRGQG